jgi:REP element-mobilizing transposase RayT
MPQSLVQNYIHLTFSTKDRYPFIDNLIEDELYKYLGGICKNLECNPVIVGGYKDHVHILCSLSRKIALMKLVEEVKSHSSKWIKIKGDQFQKFYWQKGYGAFSIHSSQTNLVQDYIKSQHEHHRKISFQDEYRTFLKEYNIEFDEKYLWD